MAWAGCRRTLRHRWLPRRPSQAQVAGAVGAGAGRDGRSDRRASGRGSATRPRPTWLGWPAGLAWSSSTPGWRPGRWAWSRRPRGKPGVRGEPRPCAQATRRHRPRCPGAAASFVAKACPRRVTATAVTGYGRYRRGGSAEGDAM